jgi:succinate dehydrogenase / fumarate reductase flavoprotein subunit
VPPVEIRDRLQQEMYDLAFVVRTAEGLTKMKATLDELMAQYSRVVIQDKGKMYNTDLMEAVELGFLLDNAEPLVVTALAREESRGAHYRDDFPNRDDVNWLKHSLAYLEEDGSVRLEFKDVKMGPYVPMERKY